jgi:hypothetical protein
MAKNRYTSRFVRVILTQGPCNLLCIVPILTDDPRRDSNKLMASYAMFLKKNVPGIRWSFGGLAGGLYVCVCVCVCVCSCVWALLARQVRKHGQRPKVFPGCPRLCIYTFIYIKYSISIYTLFSLLEVMCASDGICIGIV